MVWWWWNIMREVDLVAFYEGHMIGGNYLLCGSMIASIGFGAWFISNENAFNGPFIYFWIVFVLYQYKGFASYFAQMRETRFFLVPFGKWGRAVQRSCGGEGMKIGHCQV